jgi:pimeloyl-ACP methyl ester carboxylesterase
LRTCFADPARVAPGDVEQYYAPVPRAEFAAALDGVLRDFRFDALRGRMRELQLPTLVVWGAVDRWVPLEAVTALAGELPRTALVAVPDAGHNVQEEQAGQVNRLLIDYLRDGLPQVPPDLAAGRSSAAGRSTASRTRDG